MPESDSPLPGVVVVGASAGGVEALSHLAEGLPPDLPYPVLMVLHLPANAPSVLARIIDRSGPLPATTATDGTRLQAGQLYVAAPDRHLLVEHHRVALAEGPTENGYRPAINSLFRSAALAFGPRAISVLMSGVLDDGVLGSAAIRARGGTTIVQSPDDAQYSAMPDNAIAAGVVDHQASAVDVGALLMKLADREIEERAMEPDLNMELENRIAAGPRFSVAIDAEVLGPPSGYTCPDCNGSLMAADQGSYRCRVGHAWTAESLLGARDTEIDGALWVALRSLTEKATLARRMAQNVSGGPLSRRYTRVAEEAEHAVEVLARRLSGHDTARGDADAG